MEISIRESCIRCGRCVSVPFADFRTGGSRGSGDAVQPRELHRLRSLRGRLSHGVGGARGVPRPNGCTPPITPRAADARTGGAADGRAAVEPGPEKTPVPQEMLDRIVAAADHAPTASNARQLGYTLVTDPGEAAGITEYTLGVFGSWKTPAKVRSCGRG